MAKTIYRQEELERQLAESRREFWAADATINNLELKLADMAEQLANANSKCAALATECAGLKNAITAVSKTSEECEINGDELKYVVEPSEFDALTDLLDETPATDAFLAEVRASVIDDAKGMFKNSSVMVYSESVVEELSQFAAQLRKGSAL